MFHKLVTLVMSIFVIIAAGTCNYYPLYLSNLMKKYSYSEKQANLYGSFINLGYWLSLHIGFIYDKYGPSISLLLSCVLLPGSYTILNLLITMIKKKIHILSMIIIGFIMGQGSALCYISAISTNLKNFSKSANVIVGILLTNQAITPSLYTSFRDEIEKKSKKNNNEGLLIFLGLILALVIAMSAWLVRVQKNDFIYDNDEVDNGYEKFKEKKICNIFIILNIFTLFLFISSIIINHKTSNSKIPVTYFLPIMQAANVLIVILEKFEIWDKIYYEQYFPNDNKDNENEIKDRKNPLERKLCPPKKLNSFHNNVLNINNEEEKNSSQFDNIKLNLSFNYEKRLNDLKVKYELNNSGTGNNFYSNKENLKYNFETNNINNHFNFPSSNFIGLENLNFDTSIPKIEKREGYIESFEKEGNQYSIIKTQPNKNQNNEIIKPYNNYSKESLKDICDCESRIGKLFSKTDLMRVTYIITIGIGCSSSVNENIIWILKSIKPSIESSKFGDYSIIYFAFDSFSRLISAFILNKIISLDLIHEYLFSITFIGLISQIISLTMKEEAFYMTIILSGIVNGLLMNFIPIYTKLKYDSKDFGKILGLLFSGSAIGKVIISSFVFNIFWEMYKVNDNCYGKKCYFFGFIINILFLFTNLYISAKKIRKKYKKEKIQNVENKENNKNNNNNNIINNSE
jgi:hypothetical protein